MTQSSVTSVAGRLRDSVRPHLLAGSPECRTFSRLMQFGVMDDEKFRAARAQGLAHLHFSIELDHAQADDGRYFVHEHPDGATSWSDAKAVELIARDGVWWTRND